LVFYQYYSNSYDPVSEKREKKIVYKRIVSKKVKY